MFIAHAHTFSTKDFGVQEESTETVEMKSSPPSDEDVELYYIPSSAESIVDKNDNWSCLPWSAHENTVDDWILCAAYAVPIFTIFVAGVLMWGYCFISSCNNDSFKGDLEDRNNPNGQVEKVELPSDKPNTSSVETESSLCDVPKSSIFC